MKIATLFLTISLCLHLHLAHAQRLCIVDQSNTVLSKEDLFSVELKIDDDSTKIYRDLDGCFFFDKRSCDSLADIVIKGFFVQNYHNQYKPEQFKKLDTIQVFKSNVSITTTPQFFVDLNQNIDSAIQEHLGLANYLDQSSFKYELSASVYNTYPISQKERDYIKQLHLRYFTALGYKPDSIPLIFTETAYKTTMNDFFVPETEITKAFISSQNTDWMKQQAEKYKLVLWVTVQWKEN
jgi:hypothetical protein